MPGDVPACWAGRARLLPAWETIRNAGLALGGAVQEGY
jgi:hypothetical protein